MVGEARIVATGALRMHPEAGRCHYALALVEARARNIPAVKEALAVAFTAARELREPALDDERLREFWRTLGE
jgi:hypothetical protein